MEREQSCQYYKQNRKCAACEKYIRQNVKFFQQVSCLHLDTVKPGAAIRD